MTKEIFQFHDYKAYLRQVCGEHGSRRGVKARIAAALKCQPTYISQVILRNAHLSLEQAERVSQFLGHSEEEVRFFLLLVQKGRAGTRSLERFFQKQIEEMKEQHLVLTKRLSLKTTLSLEEQAVFYSSWHYLAAHIALTVPQLQTREALAEYFRLPAKKVIQILDFLSSIGLCTLQNGKYITGKPHTTLGSESPLIARHHSNWRQQAMISLDRNRLDDIHYSAAFSASPEDIASLKSEVLELLKKQRDTIRASPAEDVYCYTIDLFGLKG